MVKKFNTLKLQHQSRKKRHKYKEFKDIKGFDTETNNGYCFLICDESQTKTVTNFIDIAEFLLKKSNRTSLNFFYNIRYDFQAIIKHLPLICQRILQLEGRVEYKGYFIRYLPKKMFSITKRKHCVKFFDIAQYFRMSLFKCVVQYGLEDEDFKEWNHAEHNLDKEHMIKEFKKDKKLIEFYAIKDCQYCAKLGRMFYDKLKESGFYPENFYSGGSLAQDYFLQKCYVPRVLYKSKDGIKSTVPIQALEYAQHSYKGGRFEVLERGYQKECYKYDLSSAYPYQIAQLIDINKGVWKHTKRFERIATYGFYKIKVVCDYNNISPYMKYEHNVAIFPVGAFIDYVTQEELRLYLSHKNSIIEILDGWVYYPSFKIYPFKKEIEDLYNKKAFYKDKDKALSFVYKLLMNAFYGKFAQAVKNKTGKLWNPIYASVITANTRLQLYKTVEGVEDQIIAFHTDSIMSKIPLTYNKEVFLGSWVFEGQGELIILQSGVYSFRDKSGKITLGSRGFKRKNLFDELKTKERLVDASYVRPLNLGEVLVQKQWTMENLNLFQSVMKNLNINQDLKRVWNRNFSSGYDALKKSIKSNPVRLFET